MFSCVGKAKGEGTHMRQIIVNRPQEDFLAKQYYIQEVKLTLRL